MKVAKVIAKIVIALAAIAGIIYVAATYGDRIVAWCKKLLASLPCCKESEFVEDAACCTDEACGTDEACCVCEEAPAAEAVDEAPAEEAAADNTVAEEADFEG